MRQLQGLGYHWGTDGQVSKWRMSGMDALKTAKFLEAESTRIGIKNWRGIEAGINCRLGDPWMANPLENIPTIRIPHTCSAKNGRVYDGNTLD